MISVRVPATSANMGPGFDSLGIALKLYNEYEFAEMNNGVVFEGVEEEFANKDNIILKAMEKTFNRYKYNYSGLLIRVVKQQIPISRGLGSSSSCIVAGIVGAMKLMGLAIDKNEVFEIAVGIEGHPDNVSPAIFGGMTVSIMEQNKPIHDCINVRPEIKFIALIPRFRLSTAKARAVLPEKLSLGDAVFNVGRTALLVSAFTNGRYELLKYASQDKIHQNYRSCLIDGFAEIYKASLDQGALACYLSGAGPTIMAIVEQENEAFKDRINDFIKENNYEYDVLELEIDLKGVSIL